MKRIALALVSAISLFVGTVDAGDCCTYKKVICYETVVEHVCKKEAYTVCVVKYDHCGKPYEVYETKYRTVEVPVKKVVPVVKYVKVCD